MAAVADRPGAGDRGYATLSAIDTRMKIGFRYYASGSPFEYELVCNLTTWARELEIGK